MAGTTANYYQGASVNAGNNNAAEYFQLMRKQSKTIADDVALRVTGKMVAVLRYRKIMENLGGGDMARWPKWDGSHGIPSKQSYKFWEVEEQADGVWWIVNKVMEKGGAKQDYPVFLSFGYGWSTKFVAGKKLVDGGAEQLFSTQMPHGLTPWVEANKIKFMHELRQEIGALT